jgi:translation initiation factor 5
VTERYIVNGAHDASRLRDCLDVFIDKFVLCNSCKNPETELIINKDDTILRDCKACGHQGTIDMRHKLTTFIVKNPPKSKKMNKGAKKSTAGADSLPGQPGDESDDELTKKIEAGAKAVLSPEQAAAMLASKGGAEEEDEDWSIDTSKEAVAARIQALDSKLQNSLILDDDDEDGNGGPYDTFGEWVRDNRTTVTDAEIYIKAEESGLAKKHKILVVLVQAIFTEAIVSEIKSHVGLLKKVRPILPRSHVPH